MGLTGCQLTFESTERPELIEPEQEILDLEPLEQQEFASFDYPEQVESIIKSAPILSIRNTENGPIYYETSTDGDGEKFMLLSIEEGFLIRDLFVAARENKNLADKLINIHELSVEERNQLLRVLKAEAYRMKRMKAFNEYYRKEVERVENKATVEVWTTRILAALALLVAI